MRVSERGAAGRWFVIVAIVGIAGYGAWSLLHPDPYSMSERIVRESRREVAAAVREFQRRVEVAVHAANLDKTALAAEVDQQLAATLQSIDGIVAAANDRLDQLDIGLRTQRNRMDRIEGRAEEAKAALKELADETKQKAPGD